VFTGLLPPGVPGEAGAGVYVLPGSSHPKIEITANKHDISIIFCAAVRLKTHPPVLITTINSITDVFYHIHTLL